MPFGPRPLLHPRSVTLLWRRVLLGYTAAYEQTPSKRALAPPLVLSQACNRESLCSTGLTRLIVVVVSRRFGFVVDTDGVPLENSVRTVAWGFCCGISTVVGIISRCCYRSSIAC
jgi:hypothetical protein